jgi:hypothetical protein
MRTNEGTPYMAKVLEAMLPVIAAGKKPRKPRTLEFVNLHGWRSQDTVDNGTLSGVIVRNKTGDVLLHAHGIRINDFGSIECYQAFCTAFDITEEETRQLKEKAEASLNYSVILHLS